MVSVKVKAKDKAKNYLLYRSALHRAVICCSLPVAGRYWTWNGIGIGTGIGIGIGIGTGN